MRWRKISRRYLTAFFTHSRDRRMSLIDTKRLLSLISSRYFFYIGFQPFLYFTEQDTQRILDNLDGLRDLVFPRNQHIEDDDQLRLEQRFPSVCLIGLGRCGSNIALDVAERVCNARTFFLNEFNNEDRLKANRATARRAGSARTFARCRTRASSRCAWTNRW